MSAKSGTVDYSRLLKGLPVETRQRLYKELVDGKGEQPGVGEQYIKALVEYRSSAELLASRRVFIEHMNGDLTAKVQEQAREEFAQLVWTTELRRQGVESIAAELERLQQALGEMEEAGTKA